MAACHITDKWLVYVYVLNMYQNLPVSTRCVHVHSGGTYPQISKVSSQQLCH